MNVVISLLVLAFGLELTVATGSSNCKALHAVQASARSNF